MKPKDSGTGRVKLTKAERSMLDIAKRHADFPSPQWQPRIDHAHAKHQPTLLILRERGLVTFSHAHAIIRITPAGRAALAGDPS